MCSRFMMPLLWAALVCVHFGVRADDDDAAATCASAKCGWSCDELDGCGWATSNTTQTEEGSCVVGASTKDDERALGDENCKKEWQKMQDSMVKQTDAYCNAFKCAVACAEEEGCGWSSSNTKVTDEGTCIPGATTKDGEMDRGDQGCKDELHRQSGGTPCDRIKREFGIDCDSCIPDRDIPYESPNWRFEDCPARTEAEDQELETIALFGKKDKDIPKAWKKTQVLFSSDCVWDIELKFSEKNWNNLTDDPALEEYISGDFSIGGGKAGELVQTSFENVGIRFKGWFGSLRQCLAPFGEHSASCNKLSFKIKFDKFVDGQEFLGLKRLQLHAALSDPTYTREVLSYSVFREMGIAAPRGAPSTISIMIGDRRIVMGIYLLTEVIDSKFAATYFPKAAGGNMYKEGWPEMRGNPLIPGDPMDGTRGWEYPLRTNQDEQDLRRANGWSKAMAGVKDDYELVKVVKEYTHVEQMARYIAVDRFIEHWDGPVNFRADTAGNFTNGLGADSEPMGWWPHNFFMYEDGDMPREKKQFQLVAWDTDSTFIAQDKINTLLSIWFPRWDHPICDAGEWSNDGFSESGKDADGNGNPYDPNKKCIGCHAFLGMGGNNKNMPAQCFKLFRAFAHGLRSKYMEAAKELLDGPMDRCRLSAKVKRSQATLKPFLTHDAKMGLYPSITAEDTDPAGMMAGFTTTVESFDAEIDDLIDNTIPFWRNKYIDQVKCTGNYRAKDWGTSWDDGKHHFDEIMTNVVTEANSSWSTTSIMEGSYWTDRAPGDQSKSAGRPMPTCNAQTLYDDKAQRDAEKDEDADAAPASAPASEQKSSKGAVAAVTVILVLVLICIGVYAFVPGAADHVVGCKMSLFSRGTGRAGNVQSFANEPGAGENNVFATEFANPLAMTGGQANTDNANNDAADVLI